MQTRQPIAAEEPARSGRGMPGWVWHGWNLLLGVSLALFTLGGQARLAAQTTFGSILGTVTDQSGAEIPGVSVTLTNVGTQVQQKSVSDSNGNYQFLNLQPGNYSLEFTKSGFSSFKRAGITVAVQAAVKVNARLQVGAVDQTVSVNAQAPIIETQPGALSQLVEGRVVQQMPLNGRNVFDLLDLSPGVIPQGSTSGNPLGNQANGVYTNNTGFGNFQIGGGMSNESEFYLDGVPLNTTYINSPALVPTQDAIQEFRVDTNAVSAEYGHFAGGVVNMATKSGTNAWHGSAYEYIRNRVLNANNFFNKRNGIATPAFTQNQYGATIGGPIRHQKLFGFLSWENFSFRTGNAIQALVPTDAMRTGDFSALCSSYDANGVCTSPNGTQLYDPQTTCGVPGAPACTGAQTPGRQPFAYNKIPLNRVDPAAKQYMSYYGTQNRPLVQNPSNGLPVTDWAGNVSLGGNSTQYNGRIDWDPSANQQVFARYSYWSGTSLPSDPFHTHFGGLYSYTGSQNFVIGDTYTFNPRTIADFRLSYLRGRDGFTPEQLGSNLASFGPAWGSLASQVTLDVAPEVNSNGFYRFSMVDNRAIMNDYFLSGSVTRIMGRHTLKMGGEARRNEWNFAQTTAATGSFNFDQGFTSQLTTGAKQIGQTGFAGASFFLGDAANASLTSIAYTDSIEWYLGAYLQDTWQVNQRLTVTPGVRWEFPEAYTERNNRLTVALPNAPDPLGAQVGLPLTGQIALVDSQAYPHRQQIENHYKLFSPRLNIAYELDPKTSLRAGYGIAWIPPDMVNYSEAPFQSPVNAATTTMVPSVNGTNEIVPQATFGNPFPDGLIPPVGHDPARMGVFEGQSVNSPVPYESYPYAQQWDVDLQEQMAANFMFEIGYAGSKGSHLPYSVAQMNQLPDSALALGPQLNQKVANPFYGYITNGLLASKTVAQAQLLRPHPQFQSFGDTAGQLGDSHWDALETRIEKRFANGSVLGASYTWSKFISNTDTLTSWLESHGTAGVQDWNNLRAEKSLASFDVPHRFVASYVLNLPFGRNQRFLSGISPIANQIVGGWIVNGIVTMQSGYPLGLTTQSNQTDSQGGGSRPNVVVPTNAAKQERGSAQSRLGQWFNTAAFAAPAPFTFGNESRLDSTLRDAGVANWDFTLGKNFPIKENATFDFKAEIFNLFNRVQFGDPGTALGAGNFGVVTSQVNNPRLIQFSGRISF